MSEGYIKLYRSLIASDFWRLEPFTKAQAWVDLIALTNYKPGKIPIKNGQIIGLSRGQCGYSLKGLAERWRWSRNKVKRFLEYLRDEEENITFEEIENRYIITVINYARFQDALEKPQEKVSKTDTLKGNKGKGFPDSADTKQSPKRTQEKERKEERENKFSLSIEEREILKNYLLQTRKKPIDDIDAYIRKLVDNGDYKVKLEKARQKFERQKQKEVISPPEEPEDPELTEQARARTRERINALKRVTK